MKDPSDLKSHFELSLFIALGWIYVRDYAFVTELQGAQICPLNIAHESWNKTQMREIKPAVSTPEQAWFELRDAAAADKLELRGSPFRKYPHVSSSKMPAEELVYREPHPYLIDKNLVSDLVVVPGQSELRLRPKDWFTKGGWWWRDVEIFWPKLLQNFPETDAIIERIDIGSL